VGRKQPQGAGAGPKEGTGVGTRPGQVALGGSRRPTCLNDNNELKHVPDVAPGWRVLRLLEAGKVASTTPRRLAVKS